MTEFKIIWSKIFRVSTHYYYFCTFIASRGLKQDGTFLVRENSSAPGDFVLSLLYKKQAIHYQIIQHGSANYSVDNGPTIQGN